MNEKKNRATVYAILGAAAGLLLLLWGSFGGTRTEAASLSDTAEIEA